MEVSEKDLSALINTTKQLTTQLELMLSRGKEKGLDCKNCPRFKSCDSYSESVLSRAFTLSEQVVVPTCYTVGNVTIPTCGPSC